MKSLHNDYLTSITNKQVLTLAYCWKIIRNDGTIFGFTSHNRDIILIDEPTVVYKAKTGMTPTAISSSDKFNVDNLDVAGVLDSTAITESDLKAGVWDYAEVYIFRVNYLETNLTTSKIEKLRYGKLGEVKVEKNKFIAEIRGLMQFIQNNIGNVYQPTCRVNFCDSKCKLNILDYTFIDTVYTVTNNREFTLTSATQVDGYFNNGIIEFTSGLCNGYKMEIKNYTQIDKKIILQLPMNKNVVSGDTVNIIAGCDKKLNTCIGFNNAINFRGEPKVPGSDFLASGKK